MHDTHKIFTWKTFFDKKTSEKRSPFDMKFVQFCKDFQTKIRLPENSTQENPTQESQHKKIQHRKINIQPCAY